MHTLHAIGTRLRMIICLCAIVMLAGSALPETTGATNTNPAVAEVAASYRSYRQITATAVYVNPDLAALCRGATQKEVETVQKQHGPHGNTAILIYMNGPAALAFASRTNNYPTGSVIVKHKANLGYRDPQTGKLVHSADNGVGGMVKRAAGFDPEHGDWEYFYFEEPSHISSGRIASCVQCHESAKATDHVFGTWQPAKASAP